VTSKEWPKTLLTGHGRTHRHLLRFWPHYLREHARPATRAIHLLGTALATASLGGFILSGNPWFLPVIFICGYGPAWMTHFFVEHDRPATFQYPLWSLVSGYQVAWNWLTGRSGGELAKAGVSPR
jgi:hypothetical protein